MKKINKLFLIATGAFALFTYNNVYAETISLGKATFQDNVVKVPISLTVNAGDGSFSAVQFGCATNNDDVECNIEPGNNILETKGSSYNIYSYSSSDSTVYPNGSTVIGTLVLTNTKNYSITSNNLVASLENISVNVNGATRKYSGPAVSKNYSIGAKVEPKKTSSDPTLKDVSVSKGTIFPVFDKDVTDYTIYDIGDTINSIKFTLTCNDGECNTVVGGGKSVSNKTVTLNQGENKVTVTVTSQDYSKSMTYNFTVIRGDTSFNSAKLGSLSFGNYTLSPEFKNDVKDYTLIIPYEINNLTNAIDYKAEDKNANVEVKGIDSFKYGENTLTLEVTNSAKDMVNTYTVKVYRLESETIEIQKYLNSEITFKCGDSEKTVSIQEFKMLFPKEYNKILNNEYSFDSEGNITIKDDVETTTKVVVEEDKKNNRGLIIFAIIGVGLLVIGVSAFLIFRKKPVKEDTEEETKKDETKTDEVELPKEAEKENINIGDDFTDDLTVSIEDALNDLMNTKQYTFKEDSEEENDKTNEEE